MVEKLVRKLNTLFEESVSDIKKIEESHSVIDLKTAVRNTSAHSNKISENDGERQQDGNRSQSERKSIHCTLFPNHVISRNVNINCLARS